ncbi:MAG: hypothetical protein JO256_08990 [Alphaproteobacteria bacterium]|nr:hypothetical protein [Alphaproteobacteria bacterium]
MRRIPALIALTLAVAAPALAQTPLPACRVGLPVTVLACINYPGHITAHNPANGNWQVTCDSDKEKNWVSVNDLKRACTAEDVALTPAFFAGRWEMFTGGGGAYVKQASGDWKVRALDVAKTPPLVINADGSFVWNDFSKPPVRGRWRLLAPAEFKYASQKPPIILLMNAMDGKDWQVTRISPASDGRDRIELERRDLGLTYRGTRMK